MTDSENQDAQLDGSAVAAVRGGDPERYRELVERHERHVYAVAWSRLGDATLAEEVAQEAFVRAYQRLWLLGDGAKFSGWIATITRHIAINFGLRHRRELNKRQRWALENSATATAENSDVETDPPYTPETLRQTLAELPPAHRECLVLFYLEGKSGAEAAALLGISEVNLRQRLHRARAAMRERLEEKLAGSLARLGPAKSLVPAVMAVVLASSTSKAAAAGIGGTTILALAKFTPFKVLFSTFAAAPVLPGIILQWLVIRLESRNFLDRDGFRARLFRTNSRRWILGIALILLLNWTLVPRLTRLVIHRDGSLNAFYLVLAGFGFLTSAAMATRLRIIRNRYFASMLATNLFFAISCLAAGLGWMPIFWIGYCMAGQVILMALFFSERPMRTDYNLFLRAVEGILEEPEPAGIESAKRRVCPKSDLFAFARFLGSRWLVNRFRLLNDGLVLQMTPVKTSLWNLTWRFAYLAFGSQRSELILHWDGTVAVTMGKNDRQALRRLRGENLPPNAELESMVAAVAQSAWEKFHAGDFAAAERLLGQVPESEVFVRPQAKSLSTQLQRAFMLGLGIFMVFQLFQINQLTHSMAGIGFPQDISGQSYQRAMSDLKRAKTAEARFDTLGPAAKESFVAGEVPAAQTYATELMTLLHQYKGNWNYGNAIQDANLVLGRIALREGKIKVAEKYLIAAGKSPGSAVMDSFGPNLTLAQDLLEKGESDTVLEYFMRCHRFWKMGHGKLDEWTHEVMNGQTPDFGANLLY